MMLVDRLQAHRCFPVVHTCHETPSFSLLFQFFSFTFKLSIERRQLLPELFESALHHLFWNEEFLFYILLFYLIPRLACENHEFSHHIFSAEIDAWVGFTISQFLSAFHGEREGCILTYLVEDEVECTAEYSLNLQYLVARVSQVVNGADDRQSCSHVGFEEKFHSSLQCRLLQSEIALIVARCRYFISSHHRDVVFKQCLIDGSHFTACRAVNEHAVEDVHPYHLLAQMLCVAWFRLFQ